MAQQVDVKWPSEDEEFDTKTAGGEAPTATETQPEAAATEAPAQEEAAAEEATEETPTEEAPPAEEAAPAADPASEAEAPAEPVTPAAAPVTTATAPRRSGNLWRTLLEVLLLIAVVALALWGFNLQSKNKNLQKQVDSLNNNPAIVEQRKTNELVNKVGALMVLPTGEQPQAALVSNAAALKQQYPFFAPVQNGDEILFYFKAGKVIVYRPSTNKIVQTGPLSVNQSATTPTAGTSSTSTKR